VYAPVLLGLCRRKTSRGNALQADAWRCQTHLRLSSSPKGGRESRLVRDAKVELLLAEIHLTVVEFSYATRCAFNAVTRRVIIPSGITVVWAMSVVSPVDVVSLPIVRILGRISAAPIVVSPIVVSPSVRRSSGGDSGTRADRCNACAVVGRPSVLTTRNARNADGG
jgi:hypothetical protein